ncbi:MAG TPA: hypothetical protein PKD54_11820, partial [Pirellulaceae bacterium]|nr:hypothetical protein [Pirellulaceae bacterium]
MNLLKTGFSVGVLAAVMALTSVSDVLAQGSRGGLFGGGLGRGCGSNGGLLSGGLFAGRGCGSNGGLLGGGLFAARGCGSTGGLLGGRFNR